MAICIATKKNGESCRCHAIKGFTCCYGHRDMEVLKTAVFVPEKPKNQARVVSGYRVAALNAIRKEFLLAAQFEGGW